MPTPAAFDMPPLERRKRIPARVARLRQAPALEQSNVDLLVV